MGGVKTPSSSKTNIVKSRLDDTDYRKLQCIVKSWQTDESKAIRRLIREGYKNLKGIRK